MPIGKDIYSQISKKSGERKARIEKIVKKRMKSGEKPSTPPTVKQVDKNVSSTVKSNSLHITELAKVKRQVSPNEGMPAVNGKSGKELVAKAVSPVRSKVKLPDPTAGVIKLVDKKKSKSNDSRKRAPRLCGTCKQPGHTKRKCPTNS